MRLIIPLTDKRPISILEEEWPIFAEATCELDDPVFKDSWSICVRSRVLETIGDAPQPQEQDSSVGDGPVINSVAAKTVVKKLVCYIVHGVFKTDRRDEDSFEVAYMVEGEPALIEHITKVAIAIGHEVLGQQCLATLPPLEI